MRTRLLSTGCLSLLTVLALGCGSDSPDASSGAETGDEAEVVAKFDRADTIQLSDEAPDQPSAVPQGLRKGPTVSIIDVSDKEMFKSDAATLRINRGSVKLDTSYDVGMKIKAFRLQELHIITH